MMNRLAAGLCGLAVVSLLGGCATGGSPPPDPKRQAVQTMRNEVLAELYRVHPRARARIAAAPGYAVYSNTNVNVIFASFGGGYGVVTIKNGRPVYMKMGEAGIGLGLGPAGQTAPKPAQAPHTPRSPAIGSPEESIRPAAGGTHALLKKTIRFCSAQERHLRASSRRSRTASA